MQNMGIASHFSGEMAGWGGLCVTCGDSLIHSLSLPHEACHVEGHILLGTYLIYKCYLIA